MELALENPFTILYMGSMSNLNGCRCVFPRSLGKPHQTISDQCRIVQDSYIASKCTLSSYCVYGLDSRRASLLRDSSRVKLMDPPSPTVVCAWLIQPPPSLLGIGPLLPLCWTRPCTSPVPLWPTLETWICRARWFFFGEEISNDWGIYWDYWHLFGFLGSHPFSNAPGKCIDEKTPLLRSMDAVKVQGLRLLKAVGLGKDANTMHSYLGWEQERKSLTDIFKGFPYRLSHYGNLHDETPSCKIL
jgi:hypothetical protein